MGPVPGCLKDLRWSDPGRWRADPFASASGQRKLAEGKRDAILSRDRLRLDTCFAILMGFLSQRGNEFCKQRYTGDLSCDNFR